jgi:hypothetical protein
MSQQWLKMEIQCGNFLMLAFTLFFVNLNNNTSKKDIKAKGYLEIVLLLNVVSFSVLIEAVLQLQQ